MEFCGTKKPKEKKKKQRLTFSKRPQWFDYTLSPISTMQGANSLWRWSFAAKVWLSTQTFSRWKTVVFLAACRFCADASFHQPQSEYTAKYSRKRHEKTTGGLPEILWPSLNRKVETQRTQTVGRSQLPSWLWHQLFPTTLECFWGKRTNKTWTKGQNCMFLRKALNHWDTLSQIPLYF